MIQCPSTFHANQCIQTAYSDSSPVLLGGPGLRGWFGAPREVRAPVVLAEGYLRDTWRHRTLSKRGPGPFAGRVWLRTTGSGCSVV